MNQQNQMNFEEAVDELRRRIPNKVFIWPPDIYAMDHDLNITKTLEELGIEVTKLRVDINEFEHYLGRAKYNSRRKNIYKSYFCEKTLEHFIGFKLLQLGKDDIFIDIASADSPVSQIFKDLSGCYSYSHDICYRTGINNNKIGSDASDILLPNSSVNGAIAACSVEHFEGVTDILWMKEMSRILKKDGKVIVVPLYLDAFPHCVTDPRHAIAENVAFDDKITVYARKGYNNRHGRHYSPETLFHRLIRPNLNSMHFHIYVLENGNEIDKSIYCKFILEAEKR